LLSHQLPCHIPSPFISGPPSTLSCSIPFNSCLYNYVVLFHIPSFPSLPRSVPSLFIPGPPSILLCSIPLHSCLNNYVVLFHLPSFLAQPLPYSVPSLFIPGTLTPCFVPSLFIPSSLFTLSFSISMHSRPTKYPVLYDLPSFPHNSGTMKLSLYLTNLALHSWLSPTYYFISFATIFPYIHLLKPSSL
jgi:hypothetical protein